MTHKTNTSTGIYEKHYNDPEIIASKESQARYFIERTMFSPPKNTKVFEPGCGVGIFGLYIKNKFSVNVYGMELSRTAIKLSKSNGIKVKKGDLNNMWPYKSNYFDYVVSSQVIEHIFDTDNFVTESIRVLKKGGYFYVSTPNLASWFNRFIFSLGYQPFFTEISNKDKTLGLKFTQLITGNREPLGHIRVFTLRGLVDLLEYHGFEILAKYGGEISYLPKFMKPFDKFFSNFPSLSSDLFVVARKK
ncbi:MAG: class I SAM-dependent methyltransferase [Patescibacteria group bacterium]